VESDKGGPGPNPGASRCGFNMGDGDDIDRIMLREDFFPSLIRAG